jgi:glycosyltransferase involved in cell wall biosynthesis
MLSQIHRVRLFEDRGMRCLKLGNCAIIGRVLVPSQSSCRVGLNAHLLSLTETYRGAGINGYIFQLLHHLPKSESDIPVGDVRLEYNAYLYDRKFEAPTGLSISRSKWDTRSPWRRILWEQTRLAVASRNLKLLHGLAFAAPLAARCPTVITVHDLSFLRFPDAFRPFHRCYLGLITRVSALKAARVIAVSESTRQDVISLCQVPSEKVVVIPNGVTRAFSPAPSDQIAAFRQQKGLPQRYILFVGTLEPRKNLVRLIDAYAEVCRACRLPGQGREATQSTVQRWPPALVIVGGKGWFYDKILARVAELGLSEDVIFPGFVPADELPWWYRAADLFVYPSVFEGFGLPVLEAMACGTPTITSAVSSLPEVAGDAALLVNPEDTDGLTDAILQILADQTLADQLREAGFRQVERFSWAHTAIATAAVYRDVLGLSMPGRAA